MRTLKTNEDQYREISILLGGDAETAISKSEYFNIINKIYVML